MSNAQQNPSQKTQDDRYSNQSKQNQDNNRSSSAQGSKDQDPRRDQDLPRASGDRK